MNSEVKKILEDDVEEEILERLPEWFRTLREGYRKRL